MQVSAHFSDIQTRISEEISIGKYQIFVAVAWITDKSLWAILTKKSKEGLNVQVILVPDKINLEYKEEILNFMRADGQLFWDEHHHKFSVIDVKTVITGSYNWTNAANLRGKRENVVIIKQNEEIAEKFADEFKILLKQASKYELPKEKEIVYVEKPVEREIVKVVEKPVVQIVEKPVVKYVEKPIQIKVKEDINKFTIYAKGNKFRCGKCHSAKLEEDPKAPGKIQNIAKFYCKDCNTYFDGNGISI
jgi:hypothetical protein